MPIYKKGGAKGDCKKPKIWNPNTKRCVKDTKGNRNKGAKTATQGVIVIQVPEQGNCVRMVNLEKGNVVLKTENALKKLKSNL
jgi:hypothetical protein